MRKYRLVAKKGEGTFSEVLKAQNVKDGKYHAIKCMKNRFDSIEQVNNLREIQALRRLSPHEHVITLEEVLYDQPTGRLALVFELMDANLYELIRGRKHYLNPQLIKSYMWQLMKSLDHMHKKGIFHRDIKPENILIESSTDVGSGLKLADFGSCRGIYSKQPYTEYISTRWYRAPECLLTDGFYGPEMDLWGAGCVMFEITSLYPLFPGKNEVDQAARIHRVLGSPSAEIIQRFKSKVTSLISLDFPPQKGVGIPRLIPHASSDCIDLIVKLLKYDATERITAREAMRHPYFRDVRDTDRKSSTVAVATASAETTRSLEGSDNISVGSDGMAKVTKPSAFGVKTLQGQLSSSLQKALPSILGKGTGGGAVGGVGMQKNLQQQQNFLVKASGTTGRATGVATSTASTLPPIGGGGAAHQYGSTVGSAVPSRTQGQKPTWQQRRKKSKIGYFAGTAAPSSNMIGQGVDQYLQDRQWPAAVSDPVPTAGTGTGTGAGLIHPQAQQRAQVAKAYGVSSFRTGAGAGVGKAVGKAGAIAAAQPPLNSKKM